MVLRLLLEHPHVNPVVNLVILNWIRKYWRNLYVNVVVIEMLLLVLQLYNNPKSKYPITWVPATLLWVTTIVGQKEAKEGGTLLSVRSVMLFFFRVMCLPACIFLLCFCLAFHFILFGVYYFLFIFIWNTSGRCHRWGASYVFGLLKHKWHFLRRPNG